MFLYSTFLFPIPNPQNPKINAAMPRSLSSRIWVEGGGGGGGGGIHPSYSASAAQPPTQMICIYVSVYLCISYSVLIFDHSNPEDAKRITCSIDSFEPTDSEASSGEALPRVFECYRWMEVDEMR